MLKATGRRNSSKQSAVCASPLRGQFWCPGRDVTGKGPLAMREAGLSYIPEDRHNRGLVLDFNLTENMMLGNIQDEPFSRNGLVDYEASEEVCETCMERFDVRAPGPDILARNLSGGNQQKMIIAREMYRDPKVILAVQPTRGLDVGAIEFVHQQLVAAGRGKGRAARLVRAR